jgi:EmrB/QacA subfamily drug resistance transporter
MPPVVEQPKPQPAGIHAMLVLICVSAPSFMLQLDSNIVAVSLPSITESLGATFAGIEWVITAYTLSFASLLLPAGALADRFGRKRVLVSGLGLFTLASSFCGAAPNLSVLIAARAVQGVGAALQLSAALATLASTFKGDTRARAFAFWGSVVGVGITLGPIVGGLITQTFGWQWAFYINLPIGVVSIATIVAVIDESRDPAAVRFDLPGVLTFSAFLFLTTLGLIAGNHDGWTSPHILVEGIGAVIFFLLFIVVEKLQSRPMVDFSFFRRPTYLGANVAQFSFAAGLLTMLTFMPIYFQHALGLSPRATGLLMLPMALPLFIVPRIVTAQLSHRLTGRTLLTAGLALVSAGLAFLSLAAGALDYRLMLVGMLATGLGAGLLNGETTKVGMTVIPAERAGMASGISGTMRFTGIVIGFAALSVVLFSRISAAIATALPALNESDRLGFIREIASGNLSGSGTASRSAELHTLALKSFADGYAALFATSAGFCLVAAVITWLLVRDADTAPIARPAPLKP